MTVIVLLRMGSSQKFGYTVLVHNMIEIVLKKTWNILLKDFNKHEYNLKHKKIRTRK